MNCKNNKCAVELLDDAVYCHKCGRKQILQSVERKTKSRGNGTGTVIKRGKVYQAVFTPGYIIGDDGKRKRNPRTKSGFKTKKEALEYLPILRDQQKKDKKITFKGLYDIWYPLHRAGKETLDCYRAAFKYYNDLWYSQITQLDVDDLQDCIDGCPKGKQTKKNMKTVCGLIYKYGIPRGYLPEKLNLADYLVVTGEATKAKRAFSEIEIEKIRLSCGKIDYADYIYCLIYTGFRLGEFLALEISDYDKTERCFVGGSKTDAGKDRHVTISPKIQHIIDGLVSNRESGSIFYNRNTGKRFSINSFREDYYYPALESIGIEKPQENNLTPHTCRRTFATLMKRVTASSKDKLELIGHTSEDMLRYYQDVSIEDLRKITDAI